MIVRTTRWCTKHGADIEDRRLECRIGLNQPRKACVIRTGLDVIETMTDEFKPRKPVYNSQAAHILIKN